jgi:hypothetical protein
MAGLVPAIHDFQLPRWAYGSGVDARNKSEQVRV